MSENKEKSLDPLLALSDLTIERMAKWMCRHEIPFDTSLDETLRRMTKWERFKGEAKSALEATLDGEDPNYWREMWRAANTARIEAEDLLIAANARGDELLAADIEYDAAEREWDLLGPDGLGERDTRSANCSEYERYRAASQRRAAAIAALTTTPESN